MDIQIFLQHYVLRKSHTKVDAIEILFENISDLLWKSPYL